MRSEKIKSQLKSFGLNHNEWLVKCPPLSGHFRIMHKTIKDLQMKGRLNRPGGSIIKNLMITGDLAS